MKYALHVAVILLCGFSLLWRIDGTILWRDEATTADWARLMVEHKLLVPRVFDGQRLVAQAADGHDFDDRFLPVMQGWLQFYVAALSFWIFGAGTLSARLPFVLAGALALWVLYCLGKRLFPGSLAALAAPIAGATSIYFLTAARQARYYALVVLLTSCILLEFCRYLQDSSLARRWGFYLRLGLYGLLVYLANYVSFGGLWISLTVFVLLTRDHALIRRFLLLSAVLAVPLGAEFLVVHAQFVKTTSVAQPAHWRDYADAFGYHGIQMLRMIPLAAILPAAWYVFWRRRGSESPAVRGMSLLAVCIVVISVVATVAVARDAALARYYFQILPPLLLLVAILAERLWVLAGPARAVVFFVFAIAWPNLNFYNGWCEDAVERQLIRDHTTNESIVDYLARNVPHNETVAFYRNVQGMMAYFDLPWLQWVDLLDSDEPRNQRLRAVLPPYVFDDWDGVDWYVVWDNHGKMPKKLTADYQLVWSYTYTDPKSWWDRHDPSRVLGYRVYRRAPSAAAGAGMRK